MSTAHYQDYRKCGQGLNSKLVKTLERDRLMASAKVLGLLQNNTLVFDDEEQSNVLMDFAIHEPLKGGPSTLELYQRSHQPENEMESFLLNAMSKARASLYEVIDVHPEKNTLVYRDLLNPDADDLVMTDIHFSQSVHVGTVVFSRIIPCPEFNMSSGVAFPFDGGLKKYLLRRHKTIMKKVSSDVESVRRYAAFFKLFRSEGQVVVYE